ncbi:hypothetical protein RY831_15180 [Noviherbaspirillum sp. CPCC 100848]|uniref:Transmembrane protein n=1 Tax=Noviherbaspirillum album TaxID=3080276 RepID=A0ABU6JA28_9BURK|nr:hypothetical protein [Noviherbaspirillum sp. CPCC 100848]MEC4720504.1 hypothetical protein [Noviherbaspirillum sp. CPCC 100848]
MKNMAVVRVQDKVLEKQLFRLTTALSVIGFLTCIVMSLHFHQKRADLIRSIDNVSETYKNIAARCTTSEILAPKAQGRSDDCEMKDRMGPQMSEMTGKYAADATHYSYQCDRYFIAAFCLPFLLFTIFGTGAWVVTGRAPSFLRNYD